MVSKPDVMVSLSNKANDKEPLPKVFEELLQTIFDTAPATGFIDDATALHFADDFMQALHTGYGKTLAQVAYDSPDYIMLESMKRDVYKFSAAKNYQMNAELSRLLTDGDRRLEYEEWRQQAVKVTDTWVNAWGRAEHTTLTSTAQNNADYVRFKANADTMPLLRRSGVKDGRECPICAGYEGLTLPIGHPAWQYAYGDLHFQDRCRMLQLPDGQATPEDQVPGADGIPDIFRVNQAEKMLAFPPGHPYYTGLSQKKLNKWVTQKLLDAHA